MKVVKRTLCAVLVATLSLFVIISMSPASDAADLSYIDSDGSTQVIDDSLVTVLDQAYFDALFAAALPYGLDDTGGGWFIVRGTIDLTGALAGTITISGNVRLILEDGCALTVEGTGAGVNVTGANVLTIYAQSTGASAGALTASGGTSSAGIGSGLNQDAGTITINGGMITATAGSNAAGIGGGAGTIVGGPGGAGGNITINGGTIIATGHAMGAGIGGGQNGVSNGRSGPAGTIVINGGDITAIGGGPAGQGLGGAGIGSGGGSTTGNGGGSITINGGTVKATANGTGTGAAAIGGGRNSNTLTITINGGDITANAKGGGAGIGGGYASAGGIITITGGNIKATGGTTITGNSGFRDGAGGAGIGGGYNGAGGTITISGGTIEAIGGGSQGNNAPAGFYYGAGIGGGSNNNGGTILIYGEDTVVTAIAGGTGAMDIGAGRNSSGGSVFVALIKGNLKGTGDVELGNAVHLNADPATATGIVRVTLPAPYSRTIDLVTGLGTGAAGKDMSVLTSIAGTNLPFELAGYTNSPVTKTGTYLMTDPNPLISFSVYYIVTAWVALGDGSAEIGDGTVVFDTIVSGSPAKPIIVPYYVSTIVITSTADPGFRYEKAVIGGVDNFFNPATETIVGNTSVNVYFLTEGTFATLYNELTITIVGDGSVEVSDGVISLGTFTPINSGSTLNIPIATTAVILSAIPDAGMTLIRWENDATGDADPYNLTMNSDKFVTAVFDVIPVIPPIPPGTKNYFITAIADTGSTISPAGVVTVPNGNNQLFTFSAKAGYVISGVWIDGVPLTQAEIQTGSYTFFDVKANHVIKVSSTAKGSGGGGDDGSGGGDDGRGGDDERGGDGSLTNSKLPWWILLVIGLLFLAGFFWWFLFYYRRKYDVIKVESPDVTIIGDDKVRRKTAYHFTVEGKISGDIYYRIGYDDDTPWKIITPDQNGEYIIPRKEVINDITIELR